MNKKFLFLLFLFLGITFYTNVSACCYCNRAYHVDQYYCGQDPEVCEKSGDSNELDCANLASAQCGPDMKIMKQGWTFYVSYCCCEGDGCDGCNEDCEQKAPEKDDEPPKPVATALEWQSCSGESWDHSRMPTCDGICGSSCWNKSNGPYFHCSGQCLYPPEEVRYYNDPYYPQKPGVSIVSNSNSLNVDPTKMQEFKGYVLDPPECDIEEDLNEYPLDKDCLEPSEDQSNIDLPLKIDWNESAYWQNPEQNEGPFVYKKYTGGSRSYVFLLDTSNEELFSNPNPILFEYENKEYDINDFIAKNLDDYNEEMERGYFITVLNLEEQPSYISTGTYRSSEYNLRVDHNPCWLKSANQDEGYTFTVYTCCNYKYTEGGTKDQILSELDCNTGAEFNFKTSYAPELKSPEDLDWDGPGYDARSAWRDIDLEEDTFSDQFFIIESREKYQPLDWKTQNVRSYAEEISPPIILDWCDVEEINGQSRTEKGMWALSIFQVDKENEADIPEREKEETHEHMPSGRSPIPPFPKSAGTDWEDVLFSVFSDEQQAGYFTKEEKYSWEIDACLTEDGDCRGVGQHWSLETDDTEIGKFAILIDSDSPQPVPLKISWLKLARANSFRYSLDGGGEQITTSNFAVLKSLALDTFYTFSVTPCSDFEGKEDYCEYENTVSTTFKTTGAPPQSLSPANGEEAGIPLSLSWAQVGGAKSYIYSVGGEEFHTTGNSGQVDYPTIKSDTDYSWQVKTCADSEGSNCGVYSDSASFKTLKLTAPENISTENNGGVMYSNARTVTWDRVTGAKAYSYGVQYSGDDVSKACRELASNPVNDKIVISPQFHLPLACAGSYSAYVEPCLDYDCEDKGERTSFSFNLDTKKAPEGADSGGLVSCGREYDDPNTAWDDTLPCEIKHIFLLVKNIIDFFLWRIFPALLVVMLLFTGGIYLFIHFIEAEIYGDLWQKTKQIWKAVAIGAIILFLSWTIINFILLFFDYNMSVFGNWWNPGNY